jgi:tetraacyldisaccharide 4'-kinase
MSGTRSFLLYPFSLVYGFITGLRNFLYNSEILKSHEFSTPLICVGNLSAGGTGKTPHTEYLIELLNKEFRVAFLSRGYKRSSKGFVIAKPESTVADIGDEPLQVYRRYPSIFVAVDRDRVHGTEAILKEHPETGVIILDDGFQHRKIKPGLSVLLSDFGNLMIRDHLLPYGNLRENKHNMSRADIILITKSPANISPIDRRLIVRDVNKKPYQNLYFTTIHYKDPVPLFDTQPERPTPFAEGDPSERGFVIVTGIANPELFAEYAGKRANEVVHLKFGDHHNFTLSDIEKITTSFRSLKARQRYLITTEKDGVRLREFTTFAESEKSVFYYVPIGISFLNDDRQEFDNLIIDYVRKNKRNNRIS